jgi:hypothetical protein
MIRSNSAASPRRRIAVIGIPRPQQTRLGMIRPAAGPAISWCTVNDEGPESTGNFLANALMRQTLATQQTRPNVAPWNSWAMPYAVPGTTSSPGTGRIGHGLLWIAASVAASLVTAAYLAKGKR